MTRSTSSLNGGRISLALLLMDSPSEGDALSALASSSSHESSRSSRASMRLRCSRWMWNQGPKIATGTTSQKTGCSMKTQAMISTITTRSWTRAM